MPRQTLATLTVTLTLLFCSALPAGAYDMGEGDAPEPPEDCEVLFQSANRKLLVHTGAIPSKTTRNTQGVAVIMPKKNQKLESVSLYAEGSLDNPNRYRKNIPSPGAI